MLKKLYLSSFVVLLIAVFSLLINNSAFAQDSTKDQLYYIHEETAKYDMIAQYIETSKEWNTMMKDAGLPLNFNAYERNDLHFYYVAAISGYAAIDSMNNEFESAINKIGRDKWSSFMTEANAPIKTNIDYVVRWSADLSYAPKDPRIKLKDAGFLHWSFIHYKLDKRKEVMDVLKRWKALYEKYNFPDAYNIFLADMGRDNNELVVFDYAKDAVAYYQNDSDKSKEMKDDENKLMNEITPYIISIQENTGRPRADLSYMGK
jgi:hypothetical protein